MALDKAIKELVRIAEEPDEDWLDFEYKAIKLGIEALKKWKVLREGKAGIIDPLLPGETEE